MPRKQPARATNVIDYFKNAELAAATAILAVASDIVRARQAPKATKFKAPVPTVPPVNEATPIAAPKVKKSHKKKPAAGPGPVAEVG